MFISGCGNYARIEDVKLGMTATEVTSLEPSCVLSGKGWEDSEYRCWLSAPKGNYGESRTNNPYILKFKNNRLQEIVLDEAELDRQQVEYRSSFGFGYGYPYHRHYYRY